MNIIEINAVLEKNNAYILSLVNKKVFRNNMQSDVLELERDELAQRVRIKLWHALEKKKVTSYKTYIRQIVQHEFISMIRQNKVMLPLPLDQDGELISSSIYNAMFISSEGKEDPSKDIEQKETYSECLNRLAYDTIALPSHQRCAMICHLKEEFDDVLQLNKIFRAHNISLNKFFWPREKQEEHNLKSSLSHARKKLGTLRKSLLASN